MFLSIVAELAVDLVGKEIEVVLFAQGSNSIKVFLGIEVTRGVVGVTNHNGLGARGDDLFEFFNGGEGKACADVTGDGDNLCIAQFCKSVVVCIIWLGDDDFISGIETNGESHL